MMYWDTEARHQPVWITAFLLIPVILNWVNVKQDGILSLCLTGVKALMILALILLGILLPMGALSEPWLQGTGIDYQPVAIDCDVDGEICVPLPGFNCLIFPDFTNAQIGVRFLSSLCFSLELPVASLRFGSVVSMLFSPIQVVKTSD
jgi:hypothetical protein